MNCQNCQAEVSPEASFCQNCGANIERTEEAPSPEGTAATSSEVNSPSSVSSQEAGAPSADVQADTSDESTKPLGIITYFLMIIVFSIPIVNIIMMIVWTVSSKNINKKNFAAAALIWTVVLIIIAVLFSAVLGYLFSAFFEQFFEVINNEQFFEIINNVK